MTLNQTDNHAKQSKEAHSEDTPEDTKETDRQQEPRHTQTKISKGRAAANKIEERQVQRIQGWLCPVVWNSKIV